LDVETWLVEERGNQPLIEIIRAKIASYGPVSFAWFMEQALYHPEHGYYTSGRAKLGRRGDYFTNVSVGPIFGRLLALQFQEIWERLGRPDDFAIVEQGAHNGELAGDVLDPLATNSPDCFDRVRYRIVEPFPVPRQKQERALARFSGRIEWFNSLDALPSLTGVFFSNELLDAMPVNLFRRHEDVGPGGAQWMEKNVDWQNGSFAFTEGPVNDALLQEQLLTFPTLPSGSEVEVNLAALKWMGAISDKLRRGFILTIDYGYVSRQLSAQGQSLGSLQCRQKHQQLESPFAAVGECDITAHVNWTAVARQAQKQGLRICGFTDQHHFLTGIISTYPGLVEQADAAGRRQLQTLLHPETMGRSFQVLALSCGISPDLTLSGLKFAQLPLPQLGIS
jgi:SAM-dependent MidA family methyltransferase